MEVFELAKQYTDDRLRNIINAPLASADAKALAQIVMYQRSKLNTKKPVKAIKSGPPPQAEELIINLTYMEKVVNCGKK